ncbi:MAG: hypothetical protein ACM3VS_15275, partial [Candidatus Dadabacteria bacterium]
LDQLKLNQGVEQQIFIQQFQRANYSRLSSSMLLQIHFCAFSSVIMIRSNLPLSIKQDFS